MLPRAARRTASAVKVAETIIAIELLLATQALDLRYLAPAPALAPVHATLRSHVPAMATDRILASDIAAILDLL
jgi:histidine ammonia-lyase